jgi:aromatic amino acid aminotransferase I
MFSFVPPTSGMFVWVCGQVLQISPWTDSSLFTSQGQRALETKLWVALAEAGALVGPGWMFSCDPVINDTPGQGHFRISFSNAGIYCVTSYAFLVLIYF